MKTKVRGLENMRHSNTDQSVHKSKHSPREIIISNFEICPIVPIYRNSIKFSTALPLKYNCTSSHL